MEDKKKKAKTNVLRELLHDGMDAIYGNTAKANLKRKREEREAKEKTKKLKSKNNTETAKD